MTSPILDHPLLPEAEIRSLISAYRAGDKDAGARVIAHNEKAIYRIARRYHATGVCGDVPMDDLMQLGRMGVIRAMRDFDIAGDTKFITYAWAWIRQSISRYGKHEGQQVALSYRAAEHRGTLGKAIAAFAQEHHRQPRKSELAARTGWSEEYIASLRAMTVSFDEPVHENGKTIADFIADNDHALESEDRLVLAAVSEKIAKFPLKWKIVLVEYYGLDGNEPRSMKTIARRLKISPERVRQIRENALCEIRKSLFF